MPYPEKFRKSLCEHNVDGTMIDRIFTGYEELNDKSSKQQKIAFFYRAMQQMDELMNYDTKYEIIDWCACCKGGARDKAIRKLAKELAGQSLTAKLEALRQVANMGQPSFAEDGRLSPALIIRLAESIAAPVLVFITSNWKLPSRLHTVFAAPVICGTITKMLWEFS